MSSTPARPDTYTAHYGQPTEAVDYLTNAGTPTAYADVNIIDGSGATTIPSPADIREKLSAASAAGARARCVGLPVPPR